jgi:hypothetical protein
VVGKVRLELQGVIHVPRGHGFHWGHGGASNHATYVGLFRPCRAVCVSQRDSNEGPPDLRNPKMCVLRLILHSGESRTTQKKTYPAALRI